ncbi:MAG: IS110 family transposase [Firmicutes bacterium HGW-Firmicutes-14]|nr:MAG: IS110 family transposase [Firmicutes bacterium HGW-Firmicutes-14]
MYKPVLSLDVSKGSIYAATYLSMHEPFKKPVSVPHTPQGISVLIDRLRNMEYLTGERPQVILESTGNYSKPISCIFQEAGYPVIVLNPIQTHQQKRRSIRKVKTDPVDAKRIAELFYMQNFKAQKPISPAIADLRVSCRHYDGINSLYVESQLRFQSVLDLLFPRYPDVFSKLCGDSSLCLLAAFPTPEYVLAATKEDILALLKSEYQRKGWAENIYVKLLAAARASLPCKISQQSNIRVLREYIGILMTHKAQLADIRAQIVAAAKEIPAYSLLKTIPGVGKITAAAILAEIEDAGRFCSDHQLTAYAGLDASVFESGKFRASKNKISKCGSTYLRKALFQAAKAGIRSTKKGPVNPILHSYYSRKVADGKPKMVALVATSNKLLRIIYGMWRKNEPFKLS